MSTNAMYAQKPPPKPGPEEKFQELDIDGDSSLDLEELQGMADHLTQMTGVEMTAADLMAKLDEDGSGTLEIGEMPQPDKQGFRGPPPFLAEDGSVQGSSTGLESFNPLETLFSYLSSEDEETTSTLLDLQA